MGDEDKGIEGLTPVQNKKKRSFPEKLTNSKKRRDDLMCVICQGPASGYNFGKISCSSCKEFFRRTALISIEKTKCMNKKNRLINVRCEIRFDMKQKCQRCRLLKCFESGMRTDRLLTAEEKLSKQQGMEQNRRIRSAQNPCETGCGSANILNDIDRACLSHIENAYLSAIRSSPSASIVFSFEPSLHKTFSLTDMIEIEKYVPIKLINFLRLIPEFESLNEQDRLVIVKYNLVPLIILREALVYDPVTDLFCDDIRSSPLSSFDKIYAETYRSYCILFYGYEYLLLYTSHFRSIVNIVDNDLSIIKLLMLVLIFLNGVSLNDERIWILSNPQSVFNAHIKYVDLLFRYLIDRYTFDIAVMKMMQLIRYIFTIQKHAQIYQEKVQKESTIIEIHPLMKSLMGLT